MFCSLLSLSAVVLMVVQPEERNMYDQYCLVNHLKESYPFLCLLSFQFSLLLSDFQYLGCEKLHLVID